MTKSTKTRTLLDTQSNKFQRTCITITPDLFCWDWTPFKAKPNFFEILTSYTSQ